MVGGSLSCTARPFRQDPNSSLYSFELDLVPLLNVHFFLSQFTLVVKSKKVSEKNALLSEVHFWIENE